MKLRYHWLNHLFNFIAVILGVYLAFYMNEQAKAKEDRKESLMLMHSLTNDLSDDIKTYEAYTIPINIEHQANVDSLFHLLSANDLSDISEPLSTILSLENYAPTTSTYSSMKASGKIKLIEDLALQKQLTDFYEGLVLETVKKGDFQVEFYADDLLSWLIENADLMTMEIMNEDEVIVLRNKLLIYGSLIDQKIRSYEMIVEKSRQLKTRLDSLSGA